MNAARTLQAAAALSIAAACAAAAMIYVKPAGQPAGDTAAVSEQMPHVTIVAKRLTDAQKKAMIEQENLQAAQECDASSRV
jgi:hypothetical protein